MRRLVIMFSSSLSSLRAFLTFSGALSMMSAAYKFLDAYLIPSSTQCILGVLEKMARTIIVPEKFVKEACRRGLDVGEIVVRALAEALGMDPVEVAWARIELAEKALGEAEKYIVRGDAVQASEKLYKVVEECIKALAEAFKVKVLEEVGRRGRWEAWLLGKASRQLAEKLGEERIRLTWSSAYDIHVWGFHEVKYGIEDVKPAIPLAKWLLDYAKKTMKQVSQQTT